MFSPTRTQVHLNGGIAEAEVLHRPGGGLLVMLSGATHSVHFKAVKHAVEAHVDGFPCLYPDDHDPTKLVAPFQCKLLEFHIQVRPAESIHEFRASDPMRICGRH